MSLEPSKPIKPPHESFGSDWKTTEPLQGRYFVPNEFFLLLEHPPQLEPNTLANLAKVYLKECSDKLSEVAIDPERITTFSRTNSSSYSLVLVVYKTSQEELLAIVAKLDTEITEKGLGCRAVPQSDPSAFPSLTRQLRSGEGYLPRGVTLNWYWGATATTNGQHTGTGGPGAKPVAVAPSDPILNTDEVLHTDIASATYPVDVFVFDTAPANWETAYQRWGSRYPLWESLHRQLNIVSATTLGLSFAASNTAPVNPPPERNYTQPSHGLFVAGLIHKRAPHARIHLVQVLNDYGIGTTSEIVRALSLLDTSITAGPLARHLSAPDSTVVINLSLMITIPLQDLKLPDGTLIGHVHHRGAKMEAANSTGNKDGETPRQEYPLFFNWSYLNDNIENVYHMAAPIDLMFQEIAADMHHKRVPIVASAGNDSWYEVQANTEHRVQARYPAAFPTVIGVGALNKAGKPATYSNLADMTPDKGFMAFGGERLSAQTNPLAASAYTDPADAVPGIYISDFPNDANGNPVLNETGWAYWCGTSFAAPVISGDLARTLGINNRITDPQHTLITNRRTAEGETIV